MTEYAEKVAILVGAAHGIGRAIAEALARNHAHLVIADIGCNPDGKGTDPEAVERVAAELRATYGVEVLALAVDGAQHDTAASLVDAARTRFGRLDFGIYSAGFHHERPLLRLADDDLAQVIEVHLLGAIRFARELSRTLVADKQPGSLLLTSSTTAFFGSAAQTASAAAAGGLISFVKTAATELRRHAVRLNALIPTARTRLTQDLPLFESIRAESLTPEHVAQVAMFLLSDQARDVHGEAVGVAGSRIYTLRHSETSGAFHDGPPAAIDDIARHWRDVTKR